MKTKLPHTPFFVLSVLCAVNMSACQLTPPAQAAVVQPFVFPEEMTEEDHRKALEEAKEKIAAGEVDVNSTHAVRDAAGAGDTEYLRYLISLGADLTVDDDAEITYGNSCLAPEYDYSPLARAARYGHTETARLLIQHGATLRGVVECIENDRLEILELLRQAGANLHDGEFEEDGRFYPNTWRAESEEMLRYLIDNGISRTLNPRCGGLVSADPQRTTARINRLLRVGIWGPKELEIFLQKHPDVSYPPAANDHS